MVEAKAHAYVRDIVRKEDYFGFLCTTLLRPASARTAVLAARAFSLETAQLADSEPGRILAVQIRLEWWRNALDELYGGAELLQPQPTIQSLGLAMASERKLTKRWFERILDARLAELQGARPQSVQDLENIAEQSSSSLLYLTLEAANLKGAAIEHAAGHAGKAVGISSLLENALTRGARGHYVLPAELLRRARLHPSILRDGPRGGEEQTALLADCVYEVACAADHHVKSAQRLASEAEVTPAGFRALLPVVGAASFLEALEKCSFDIFHTSLRKPAPLRLPLRLAKAVITRKF